MHLLQFPNLKPGPSRENLAQGAKEKRLALDLENRPPRPSQPFDLDQELKVCASPSEVHMHTQANILLLDCSDQPQSAHCDTSAC